MAVEAVRRHADLRETELGAAVDFAQLECCDRIMIGPPVMSAPGLNDFRSRLKRQVEAGNMVAHAVNAPPTSLLMTAASPESDACLPESMIVS